MRILAVHNLKGGVGKTAAAVNLAYVSARGGARTLLLDLDPQGAATFYFRVRPKVKGGARGLLRGRHELNEQIRGSDFEDLDLLPADFSYRNLDIALSETKKPSRRVGRLIEPLEAHYDQLIFDCAPGISLVTESVLEASQVMLVPTIPTPLSLRALVQLVKHVRNRIDNPPRIVPFFSMVDRRKSLHRKICEDPTARAIGVPEAVIPYSTVVEQMGTRRAPVPHTMPRHHVSIAYHQLWKEIHAAAGTEAGGKSASPKCVRQMLDDAIHRSRSASGSSPRATSEVAEPGQG